jgi:transposase InsO family protein
MMAEVMGIKYESLKRFMDRFERQRPVGNRKPGRPAAVPARVRLKIRNCYIGHYKQWGPSTLSQWCKREGLGDYSPSTISSIIDDIRDCNPPKEKPRRYEITAPNVMWSEDGAGFRDYGRKRELLLLQDECSRYKVNNRLVKGPATSDDVYDYLHEAFDKHGAPLVLKHDGDSIFHEERVCKLLEDNGVINLKSPARYPPFNGKMERSIREIKSYDRTMKRLESDSTLHYRIEAAIHDLNEERPRPVLGGRTAREVYKDRRRPLPDRQKFYKEVMQAQRMMLSDSCTRKQKDDARRRAVVLVLLRQGLMREITDVSTYLKAKIRTS